MKVRLENGRTVDTTAMTNVELQVVIDDVRTQINQVLNEIRNERAKAGADESIINELIKAKNRRKLLMNNLINLANKRKLEVKDEAIKRQAIQNMILIRVIKEHISADDFLRFSEIAKQRLIEQEEKRIQDLLVTEETT